MELRPERLGMCEEGIKPRDEWGTPEVGGCPSEGLQFCRRRQLERGGLKEGEHIDYEETAVRDDLRNIKDSDSDKKTR